MSISPALNSASFIQRLSTIVKRGGIAIFLIIFAYRVLDQQLTDLIQNEIFNEEGIGIKVWIYGVASISISLLYPLFLSLITISILTCSDIKNAITFFKKKFSFLLREEMRSMGMIIFWGLLVILPAFWKIVEFIFIPMIVCLDRNYDSGKVFALGKSSALVRKKWLSVYGAVLCFSVIIPLAMFSLEEYRSFTEFPISAIGLLFVEFIITLVAQLLFIKLWENANGAHV